MAYELLWESIAQYAMAYCAIFYAAPVKVCHFYASGYVGGFARSRHCASKLNFSITQWIHAMAYKPVRERV